MTTVQATVNTSMSRSLANGLRVYAARDATVPVVALAITYDVGSRHESPGRTGLAHLFEHLMFRGSANVPMGGHDKTMQAAGASHNAMTSRDWTTYHATMPVSALETALWLEADRMATLPQILTQEVLDAERLVVKNERRQTIDGQPFGTMHELSSAAIFPDGHPYHHVPIGSLADLDAASLEDVKAFFHRHYTPPNAQVAIVGDIDPEEAVNLVERYFGGITGPAKPPRPAPAILGPLTGNPSVDARDDVPIPMLVLAWRMPAMDDPRLDAVDAALYCLSGEQSTAFARLVRIRRLALHLEGNVERLVGADSVARLVVPVVPSVGVVAAEKAVRREVQRFLDEGPTPEDLELVHVGVERSRLDLQGALETRAIAASQGGAVQDDAHQMERQLARAEALTLDDVRDVLPLFSLDHALTIRYPAQAAVRAAIQGASQGRP